MEALVHRLAPPPAYVNPDDVENGDASWGNLNELGVVKGMQIPRVPDVGSFPFPFPHNSHANPSRSPQHSSRRTQTPCRRTRRQRSSSRTERPPWRSGSRGASSSVWIHERPRGVISVSLQQCRLTEVMVADHLWDSVGNGEKSHRDQQVPSRNHGRWRSRLSILVRPLPTLTSPIL